MDCYGMCFGMISVVCNCLKILFVDKTVGL